MGKIGEWDNIFEDLEQRDLFFAMLSFSENELGRILNFVPRSVKNDAAEKRHEKERALRIFENYADGEEAVKRRFGTAENESFDEMTADGELWEKAVIWGEEIANRSGGKGWNAYEWERLEKMSEAYAYTGIAEREERILTSGEDVLWEAGKAWERIREDKTENFAESGEPRVKREKTERLLEAATKSVETTAQNVKIELINRAEKTGETDIDKISELLSEKLCEIMAKSAEGFY